MTDVSYSLDYAQTITVNTIDWSQSWTPPFPLKSITIYSNEEVLVRFNYADDPDGDRTHQIRDGQSKDFDLKVRVVYLAKNLAGDPNATVDVDGVT